MNTKTTKPKTSTERGQTRTAKDNAWAKKISGGKYKTLRKLLTAIHKEEITLTQLGFVPSTSTVARVLRRLGVDTTNGGKHRWQWGK
jgi:hypothetical protein